MYATDQFGQINREACRILRIGHWLRLVLGMMWTTSAAAATVSVSGKFTTVEWSPLDPAAARAVSHPFNGAIADHADRVGNIAASGDRTQWSDALHIPLQGDARYIDYTGVFHLTLAYYQGVNRLVTVTLLTVHFTKGALDGAWPGENGEGAPGVTGDLGVNELEIKDPDRLKREGDPVQLPTGAFTENRTLFEFSGSRPWKFGISYNSLLAPNVTADSAVGAGWCHSFETRLSVQGDKLLVRWNSTRGNVFAPKAGAVGTFVCADRDAMHDVIVAQSDGGWLLTHADQSSLKFNAQGSLVEDRDSHGRALLLTYNRDRNIVRILEPIAGTSLTFSYVFSKPVIATITDSAGALVQFGYENGPGFVSILNRIVNQNGKATTLRYDANRAISEIRDDLGALMIANAYDEHRRVVSQSDGIEGSQPMTFTYQEFGLPGSNLYAPSDIGHRYPLILPKPGVVQTDTFVNAAGETLANTFDDSGRLVAMTVGGKTTTLGYDATGNVSSITDSFGQTTPVAPKLIVTLHDHAGHASHQEFDPAFNLAAESDALDRTTRYGYDAQGNLTSVADPLGRLRRYDYDDMGRVITATDPAGGLTRHEYDVRGNLLSTTDPLGRVASRTYDDRNNLLTAIDPLGGTQRWTYDANSLPLTFTRATGGVFQYAYKDGQLAQVTDPTGVVQKFGHDAAGRIAFSEDALGFRFTNGYDAIGNVLALTTPLGAQHSYRYDHRNRVVAETDAIGATNSSAYDANGNLLRQVDPLGNTTEFGYDAMNRLTLRRDAAGRATQFLRDAGGQLFATVDALGDIFSSEYDAAGQRVATIDPLQRKTIVRFDSRGDLAESTDPLGRSTVFERDAAGQLTSATDPLDRRSALRNDSLNRIVGFSDGGGLTGAQSFDADGNLASLTDPAGQVTTFTHDLAGRLTSATTADGAVIAYAYDRRGLLASVTDASGQVTRYDYDGESRVSRQVDEAGAIDFVRDACGRVTAETENGKTLRRAYDALGRLTSFTSAEGETIGYGYDNVGRLTRLTYPDGQQVVYGYDDAGRLQMVTDWAGRMTRYRYDAAGQPIELDRIDGTHEVRAYDAAGQLIRREDYSPDGATLIGSGDYIYDAGGQLTRATVKPGMFLSSTPAVQTFDAGDRLVSDGARAITHDANGNLTAVGAGAGANHYRYDARNRLVEADGETYEYDAENHRVGILGPDGSTRLVVDPSPALSQVLVRRKPGGRETHYVYGLGLLYEDTEGEVRCHHHDWRGDTLALTNAAGEVTDRMTYGPHGELTSHSGTSDTPLLAGGALGIETDRTGLRYQRARYFHPGLRQFLTRDAMVGAVTAPATLNRYAYARGNPMRFADPTGFYNEDVHFTLTMTLAIRAGFSREDATEIATYDQATDEDSETGPFSSVEARRLYHFTTPERRDEMKKAAYDAGSLDLFGQYLHAEQDSYSHQKGETDRTGPEYGPTLGHLMAGHSPDLTYLRPELALKMAEQTYQELRKFHEKIYGTKTCDEWKDIEPAARRWLQIPK